MSINVVTFQPAEAAAYDSYMDSQNATTNYGTNALIKVGTIAPIAATEYYFGILKFDLSTIPASASILSAIMSLYIAADNAGTARTVYFYRCLRNWTEAGVTWNKYDGVNNWTTGGGTGSGTDNTSTGGTSVSFSSTQVNGDEKQFDITTLVAGWVNGSFANYGGLLFQSVGTSDQWDLHSSSSATAGYRPKLVVTYSTPGGSGWWS